MDTTSFYSIVAGTCFALVGLWWNVVQSHKEWFDDESTRSLAGGVYSSFLIPGLMALGAQVGGSSKLIWQMVFVLAAGMGMWTTGKLIRKTRHLKSAGFFRRNHWVVILLYALVIIFGIAPGLGASLTGLTPLQVEGLLIVLLILIAHGLVWEFMTEAQTKK
jgi:hypothetical protein